MLGLALVAHIANRIYAPTPTPCSPIATLLNGLGYVMLARIAQHWAPAQAGWTAIGVGAYIVTLALMPLRDLDRYRYLMFLVAVSSCCRRSSRSGRPEDNNGARLWVGWGPSTASPSSWPSWRCASSSPRTSSRSASCCRYRRTRVGNRLMLEPRPLGTHPGGVGLHHARARRRGRHRVRPLIFVLFMAMLWLTSGRWNYLALGAVLFVAGAFAADRLFSQVNVRVAGTGCIPVAQNRSSRSCTGSTAWGREACSAQAWASGTAATSPRCRATTSSPPSAPRWGCSARPSILFAFMLLVGAGLRTAQRARAASSPRWWRRGSP